MDSYAERDLPVSATPNDRAFALLRIGVGVLFLIFAQYKVLGPEFVNTNFSMWIHRFLDGGGTYPFMVPVLQNFVLPHARPLAVLVAVGESAIGLSLTLGLWSRVGSGFGLVYMLALLFSANYPGATAPGWEYFGASLEHLVLAMCFTAFVIGDPDRVLSIATAWRQRAEARAVKVAGTPG
jgi:thiosulfate dehydrogenase [quinone] large subunit